MNRDGREVRNEKRKSTRRGASWRRIDLGDCASPPLAAARGRTRVVRNPPGPKDAVKTVEME